MSVLHLIKNNDENEYFDTRPPIPGRTVTHTFKKCFSFKHDRPSNIGTLKIPPIVFSTIFLNLPKIFKLRKIVKQSRASRKKGDIRVAFYADLLDDVNGIANNLRHVVPYMRSHGYHAELMGNAFFTRSCGVVESGYVILLPRLYSMELLGYSSSELAFPHLAPALEYFMDHPIDLLELDTPAPGAWLVGMACILAGIKVTSHYRTDILTYTRTLVSAEWMHKFVLMLMRIFYWFSRPVIAPCLDYKHQIQREIKVPAKHIFMMPRGVPLNDFHPDMRGKGTWERFGGKPGKVRFAFVGRISKEKNIPYLEQVWLEFGKGNPNVELMFVGDSWYLDELKAHLGDCDNVFYSGSQSGETLAGLYADADFFAFPSTADTFGNVVVESLASGTPAIVSTFGGPKDIVSKCGCGYIVSTDKVSNWVKTFRECAKLKLERPADYLKMRENAYQRSQVYSIPNAVKKQWKFFQDVCEKAFPGEFKED